MICPQCGYDMGSKSKCTRCGYAVKTLAVVDRDESENDAHSERDTETKVIDPCNVYLTHPYGYDDDEGTGFGAFGNPFSSLFDDLFGDPIGDLLGGLFGFDVRPERSRGRKQHATEEDVREHKKRKRESAPVVEVNNVEILDENGEPLKQDSKQRPHGKKGGKFGR